MRWRLMAVDQPVPKIVQYGEPIPSCDIRAAEPSLGRLCRRLADGWTPKVASEPEDQENNQHESE